MTRDELEQRARQRADRAHAYAEALRAWMDAEGITALQLAQRLGVSFSLVNKWRRPNRLARDGGSARSYRTLNTRWPTDAHRSIIEAMGGPVAGGW